MNADLPWFRMYAEAIDDEKLRLLAFEDRWHFVAILCCKCKGLLDAGDELVMLRRKMAIKLGLAARELDAMADRLAELGLIDPDTFQPTAWDGRQFRSDSSTDRVRRYRERMAKRGCNVSETVQDTDTDTDTEAETTATAGAPAAPPLELTAPGEDPKPAKKGKAKPVETLPDAPDWIDPEAWEGFIAMRHKTKHPLTRHAANLVLRELEKMRGERLDPNASLDQSTRNNWRDVYPPRSKLDDARGMPSRQHHAPVESKTLGGLRRLQASKGGDYGHE